MNNVGNPNKDNAVVEPAIGIIAIAMFLMPAIGSTSDGLLQDTLKSALISLFAIVSFLVYFATKKSKPTVLFIPKAAVVFFCIIILSAASALYANSYLASVESIRWFIVLILFLVVANSANPPSLLILATGIHFGGLFASLWVALQYWTGLSLFPQAAIPASTFVNKNFYAEYILCTLPYSLYLYSKLDRPIMRHLVLMTTSFSSACIFLTATRSAMLGLCLLLVIAAVVYIKLHWRKNHAAKNALATSVLSLVLSGAVFSAVVTIPTYNQQISPSGQGVNAISNAIGRAQSAIDRSAPSKDSIDVRFELWRASLEMIEANPLLGVGAGSWEVQIPLYQGPDRQMEIDFYAHNELLQFAAEYGVPVFLITLIAILYGVIQFAKRMNGAKITHEEIVAIFSLLAFAVVAFFGFPLHLASTSAIFSLSLGILCAKKIPQSKEAYRQMLYTIPNRFRYALICISCVLLFVSTQISKMAFECEDALVRAFELAEQSTHIKNHDSAEYISLVDEVKRQVNKGISINPHYRKLTPLIADVLASSGNWKDAIPIWISVSQSRPYVVAILSNISRGYALLDQHGEAANYLAKAERINPTTPSLKSLRIIIWSKSGREDDAYNYARTHITSNDIDRDFAQATYWIATKKKDIELAISAVKRAIELDPKQAAIHWFKLGLIYANLQTPDITNAKAAFSQALHLSSPDVRENLIQNIPKDYLP